MSTQTTPFSESNLRLEDEAIEKITAILKKHQCIYVDNRIPDFLSFTEFGREQINTLKEWKGTKYDLLVLDKKLRFYLVEVKGKSELRYLGWSNVNDYDTYWNTFKKRGFPFVYWVYVRENGKVYVHDVVDPLVSRFEKKEIKEKTVYIIPTSLFRELRPETLTSITGWLNVDTLLEDLDVTSIKKN